MSPGTSFSIGSVRCTFDNQDKLYIHYTCQGDLGLVHELTFHGPDSSLIGELPPRSPFPYWHNTWPGSIELSKTANVKTIDIQSQHYADYGHCVVPFKVTMPVLKYD